MASEFTAFEVRLLVSMVSKYSDEEIAGMLEKPVDEVTARIHELTGGPNPYQAKKAAKKEAPVKKAKGPSKARIKAEARQKRMEVQRKLAQQARDRQMQKRQKETLFKTKVVDYSQLQTVRIDHRTVIYAKPGEDPETVRKRYLANRPKR